MTRSWNVDEVVNAFVEAAVDPSRWTGAMNIVAGVTRSVGSILFPVKGAIPGVPHSDSTASLVDSYFGDGWSTREERARGIGVMLRRGAYTDLDFITPDEMDRHPYYQELLAPHGFRWFGGVRMAAGDDLWVLAIQRSIEQEPFAPRDVRQLASLAASLSGTAALARAFGHARVEAALDVFQRTGSAVVLLDRRGDLSRMNGAAERLVGRGIDVVQRRIVSHDARATVALDRAVWAVLWREPSTEFVPVSLPRRDERALLAYPMRLDGVAADALAPCQVVIVLVDPDHRSGPPEGALKAAFGLTAAEARLAARLAKGDALDAVAHELGIAKETARSQLKTTFDKTGVSRQPELVALLASLLHGAPKSSL